MAAAQKKVVVRQTDGHVEWGYLPQRQLLHDQQVDFMAVDGKVKPIAINEIQMISYVRDFNLDDPVDPERLGRRSFVARPRGEGLWVRLGFQDDSLLEGLMPFDLGFIESVLEDQGIFLTPPDGRSNVLRIFVPRRALQSLEVLGWVTAPSKRVAAKKKKSEEQQTRLFEEAGE